MQNKNPMKFYWHEEIKIEQGHEKKTYPKMVWNVLKVIGNFTSIYTHLAPS
jgi:hypothetical protein